jgi:uncharacterized damage-inducible protein DinB
MEADKLFLITEVEGYTPQIGRLLSMMNYARHSTLESVKDISISQLDHLHDSDSNSIGALLFHIAAVEFAYRTWTFDERDLNYEERLFWEPGMKLSDMGRDRIKGNDLNYYLNILIDERIKTLEAFRNKEDSWLDIEKPFNNRPSNNHFRWFHVFEDEINHRGQIRWIIKRIRNSRYFNELHLTPYSRFGAFAPGSGPKIEADSGRQFQQQGSIISRTHPHHPTASRPVASLL